MEPSITITLFCNTPIRDWATPICFVEHSDSPNVMLRIQNLSRPISYNAMSIGK